jgi:hypothetical protein
MPRRPRLVISVKSPLLGSMIADVLSRLGADEVTNHTVATPFGDDGLYDVAITSGDLPAALSAGIVIQLPDQDGNSGIGWLSNEQGTKAVVINGLEDILVLLDRCFPVPKRRSTEPRGVGP